MTDTRHPSKQVADNRCIWVHTGCMCRTLPRPPLMAALSGLLAWSMTAYAQVTVGNPVTASAESAASCERAVRQALTAQPGRPAEVTFIAAPTLQPSLSSDSHTVLRGAGRQRGASGWRSFSYSCNVDLRTLRTIGLLMRDSTPDAAQAAPARTPPEPDLSHVSPAACESGAAEALKQRWPRVSRISFDSATRSLLQEGPGKATLHGHLRALPAPDQPYTHFGFACDIDPRDGRVLGTRISG